MELNKKVIQTVVGENTNKKAKRFRSKFYLVGNWTKV